MRYIASLERYRITRRAGGAVVGGTPSLGTVIHELSREDARRIAIRAQLLGSTRPTDLLDMVRHITLLQYDQTAAVVPNADLVAWSRLGSSYSPDELSDALAGRALIELQGMIRPSEDIALYRAEMRQWADGELTGWRKSTRNWLDKNEACRRDILERLASAGPLTSREIPDTCAVPWKSTGWNNDRNIGQMLDIMSLTGDVAVTGRRGRDRLWDLAERVYPSGLEAVPREEARRVRDVRRLRGLGIARAKGTVLPGEPSRACFASCSRIGSKQSSSLDRPREPGFA